MAIARYLIFGDLHGRLLPAFRLAMVWEREHGARLDGLLHVGDLGFFPDPSRLDRATARHAAADPMELGAGLVAEPNREADAGFRGESGPPPPLWFTAGNHEDFDALAMRERDGGTAVGEFHRGRLPIHSLRPGRPGRDAPRLPAGRRHLGHRRAGTERPP